MGHVDLGLFTKKQLSEGLVGKWEYTKLDGIVTLHREYLNCMF